MSKRDKLGLDPESAYLLERYYKDFVRAGAKLSDADKEKLKRSTPSWRNCRRISSKMF